MIKTKISLTAILGFTALTTGVLFANPALSCPFQQIKDFPGLKLNQLNPMQIGMLGIGGAATLASAGWLVTKKIKENTGTPESTSDTLIEETSFPIYVPAEALKTTPLEVENDEVSYNQPTSI